MNVVAALADQFVAEFPDEAARALEGLRADQVAELLSDLATADSARILTTMSIPMAAKVLPLIDIDAVTAIVTNLPVRVSANLLRRATAEHTGTIIERLPDQLANRIRRTLRYRPDTAGALMDPRVIALAADTVVADAIVFVRNHSDEMGHYIYVTDDDGSLSGVVTPADLIAADPATRVSAVMKKSVPRLRHDDEATLIAKHDGWWNWRSLPVVEGTVLVGVVDFEAVRRFGDEYARQSELAVSLPISLAELFWFGLIGITDGLAQSITRKRESDAR